MCSLELKLIKVIVAVPRRPDVSEDFFHAHWRGPHRELAIKIRALRRYVQSHRIHTEVLPEGGGRHDGFVEIWFDDVEAALHHPSDPDYRENLAPDEPNFADVPNLRWLMGVEEVVRMGGAFARDGQAFKVVQLVRRAPGMTEAKFRETWGGLAEIELITSLNVARYVRTRALPGTVAPEVGFDAVRELWWRDRDAFAAARAGAPEAWLALIDDPSADPQRGSIEAVDELHVL